MAKLTLTGKDFANFTMLFLHDKLLRPDEIIEADINETFNAFAEVLMRRGMKAPLLQCYMKMDPSMRVKYRLIRDVFTDKPNNKVSYIEIRKDERPAVLKVGTFDRIKSFLKKIVTLGLVVATVKAVTGNKIKDGPLK